MPLVETEISQKVIDALVIADQDFLVFDLRNYSLIKVFHTLLDATKFMENRFDEDMEQRTILFQLQGNELEFVMISDELYNFKTNRKN